MSLPEVVVSTALPSHYDFQELPCVPSLSQHPLHAIGWGIRAAFALVYLVALLAVAASIPLVNVFALGYLMESQGRVARSGKLRQAFYLLPAAQRLGGILLAAWLWLLPVQFLAQATRDSWLLAPWQTGTMLWTSALILSSLLIALHLLAAMGCGGSFFRFMRPINSMRHLFKQIAEGGYWQKTNQMLCEFLGAFRLPFLFRMGLLGYAAAYVWLVIPTLLFTLLEDSTNRWQLMGVAVGFVTLTIAWLWLPLLLTHVSAEARFSSIFELAKVIRLAGQTPVGWATATAILLACSCLPLLYEALFKIRIPPHAANWDLMVVFLVTVFPGRVLLGWVYHRAKRRSHSTPAWLWRIWQWTVGTALCIGVGFYVSFLNLAATGGDLGESSIWQFHALLLPFPK